MIKNATHQLKQLSYYEITFNGSAMIEPDGYKGITHIIEHCMCERVKELDEEFKKYSLEWNAVTGNDSMKFYLAGMSKYVNKFKDQFTDLILTYQIPQEVFERERNIIVAEYYMCFSDQTESFYLNWLRKHYNFPEAIGLIQDIKGITYEKFIEYKNKFYTNPSYVGFAHASREKDLTEFKYPFNNIKNDQVFPKFGEYKNYPLEHCASFDSQRVLMMSSDMEYFSYEEYVCAIYLASILCSGLTSPLYQELREKLQGVYTLHPDISFVDNKRFLFNIFVNTDAKKADIVLKRFKEVLSDTKKYITKAKFKNVIVAKANNIKFTTLTSYKMLSEFDEKAKAVKEILNNKSVTYEQFMKFVDKFLNSQYQFFIDSND